MARKKKNSRRTAPAFAQSLRTLIKDQLGKSQRGVAKEAGILDPAVVNRLCVSGMGSEENICKILKCMRLKRRRIVEILAERRAELCEGEAREMWKNFRYAFLDTHEYLDELCPLPLDRARAASYVGISLKRVIELASQLRIKNVQDIERLKTTQILNLFEVMSDEYGGDRARAIFSNHVAKGIPQVLYLDVLQQREAALHVPLKNCHGELLFGIPHVVFGYYVFRPNGEIGDHCHCGGVELLYSKAGTFQLTYRGEDYPRRLRNDGAVIALDGKAHHSIKLIEGQEGRLLTVRFDPRRRSLPPGPTLKQRHKRNRAKRPRCTRAKNK